MLAVWKAQFNQPRYFLKKKIMPLDYNQYKNSTFFPCFVNNYRTEIIVHFKRNNIKRNFYDFPVFYWWT